MESIRENICLIENLKKQYSDCMGFYNINIQESTKTVLSKNAKKSSSLYGMFIPDEKIKYLTGDYYGKITKEENNKDFKYYFDAESRIIMTERYSNGNLLDVVFYFYNENSVDIVRFLIKKNTIINVAKISYINGQIAEFIESYDLRLGEINYKQLVFNNQDNSIVTLNNYYLDVKKDGVFIQKKINLKN